MFHARKAYACHTNHPNSHGRHLPVSFANVRVQFATVGTQISLSKGARASTACHSSIALNEGLSTLLPWLPFCPAFGRQRVFASAIIIFTQPRSSRLRSPSLSERSASNARRWRKLSRSRRLGEYPSRTLIIPTLCGFSDESCRYFARGSCVILIKAASSHLTNIRLTHQVARYQRWLQRRCVV